MELIFDFICDSMQDKRALVNYLLTKGQSFIYHRDTDRFSVDGITDDDAERIANGAKLFGAEKPIEIEADYLPF